MLNDTKWLLEEAVRTGRTALIDRERAADLLDDLARFNARLERIAELEARVRECEENFDTLERISKEELIAHQAVLKVATWGNPCSD